jgi:hypothetical protein
MLAPGGGGLGLATVEGYRLSAGSAALDVGLLIPGNGGSDYWGNRVSDSAAPHIGAYNGHSVQP